MEHFYRIADLDIQMIFHEAYTGLLCQDYEDHTIGKPCIILKSHFEELKNDFRNWSEKELATLEFYSLGADLSQQMLNYEAVCLHASAVVYKGFAYLFSAPSGTGKSTHTRAWLKVFGSQAKILNDDKPIIRLSENSAVVWGNPWQGKDNVGYNGHAQAGGICILRRGDKNFIQKLSPKNAAAEILSQTLIPEDDELLEKELRIIEAILRVTPVWKMECTPTSEAAEIAYQAMSQRT